MPVTAVDGGAEVRLYYEPEKKARSASKGMKVAARLAPQTIGNTHDTPSSGRYSAGGKSVFRSISTAWNGGSAALPLSPTTWLTTNPSVTRRKTVMVRAQSPH